MRKSVTLVVALGISLVVGSLVLGCGPSAEEQRATQEAEASASAEAEASASAEAEASAAAEAEAEEAAELEAARTAQEKCEDQMGALLEALKQIDGRLDVGLTSADLGNRLGDVAVAYNDIPFRQLAPECVDRVGIPLEDAYNEYTKSKTKWDACIQDFSCSVEGPKLAELRRHWTKASQQIARADGVLSSPQRYMSVME